MPLPISILDLAFIATGQTARESLAACVVLAQRAETAGYRRVWYAEHHNMASIGSSATSVLIAHVAVQTRGIRLGAGGIMLPNHAPLVIAEQFGTLETLHPGRIDLGLGRAPGTGPETLRALRRDAFSSDSFPEDVLELQAFLAGRTRISGVDAVPGKGTKVPLYILGSSLFGAELAAALGLPYAFASHFAPDHLHEAVAVYRRQFKPSAQLDKPYVIAGINVIAADTTSEARAQLRAAQRFRVNALLGKGHPFTDEQADRVIESPVGQRVLRMAKYSAVGTPPEVRKEVDQFVSHTGADELIVVHPSQTIEGRLHSVELLASVMEG